MAEQELKRCTRCAKHKSPSEFYSGKARCKACTSEIGQAYRKKNRERINARIRKYQRSPKAKARRRALYSTHAEKRRQASRAYYAKNRVRLKAKQAEYNRENREKVNQSMRRWREANRETDRARARAWAAAHPEQHAARSKEWREKNKDRFMARVKARKAFLRSAESKLDADCIASIAAIRRATICWVCEAQVEAGRAQMGHVLPLKKHRGPHHPANLRAYCRPCNANQMTTHPATWLPARVGPVRAAVLLNEWRSAMRAAGLPTSEE